MLTPRWPDHKPASPEQSGTKAHGPESRWMSGWDQGRKGAGERHLSASCSEGGGTNQPRTGQLQTAHPCAHTSLEERDPQSSGVLTGRERGVGQLLPSAAGSSGQDAVQAAQTGRRASRPCRRRTATSVSCRLGPSRGQITAWQPAGCPGRTSPSVTYTLRWGHPAMFSPFCSLQGGATAGRLRAAHSASK